MSSRDASARLLLLDQILAYLNDTSLDAGNVLFYRCRDDHFVQLVRSESETHRMGNSFSSPSANLRRFIGEENHEEDSTTATATQRPLHQFTYVYEKINNKRKRADSSNTPTNNNANNNNNTATKASILLSGMVSGVNYVPLKRSHLSPRRRLPYTNGSFHAVVLVLPFRDVIADGFQVSLICEMARLLVPGGRIFVVDTVTTPSVGLGKSKLTPSSSSSSSSSSLSSSSSSSSFTSSINAEPALVSVHALFASFFRTIVLHSVENTPNQDPSSSSSTFTSTPTFAPTLITKQHYIYIGTSFLSQIDRPIARRLKQVCIFSSVRGGHDPAFELAATEVANVMATRKINLLHGGGTHGYMGIIARKVQENGGQVLGVIPAALRHISASGATVGETKFVKTMDERKNILYPQADAFIIMPGGCGTLAEMFEVLCEHQLGIHQVPIGILNVNGIYDKLLEFIDYGIQNGLIKNIYKHILLVSDDVNILFQKLERYIPIPGFVPHEQWRIKKTTKVDGDDFCE